MTIFRCSLQVQVTVQGCQSGRFAAKFYKFGRIPGCLAGTTSWLAVWLFWPFSCSLDRKSFPLAVFENNFYLKTKMSTKTPLFKFSPPVRECRLE